MVSNEWGVSDHHIHVAEGIAIQVEAIGQDEAPPANSKLVGHFIPNARVDALLDFHAEYLFGWIATQMMDPRAGRPEEDPTTKTRVEHPVIRRPDGPPDEKLGDLGVRIEGAQRLGVLALLRFLGILSHALCYLKPRQRKLRERHPSESADLRQT